MPEDSVVDPIAALLRVMDRGSKLRQLQVTFAPDPDAASDLVRAGIGAIFWPMNASETNAGNARLPVLSVDYSLARDGMHHPVPEDDVVAAYEWVLAQGAASVALGGGSAGACLAASAALRARDAGRPPSRLLLVSPLLHSVLPEPSPERELRVRHSAVLRKGLRAAAPGGRRRGRGVLRPRHPAGHLNIPGSRYAYATLDRLIATLVGHPQEKAHA